MIAWLGQLLVCGSLAAIAYEDFKKRRVHNLIFIPLALGAAVMLAYFPIYLLLVLPVLIVAYAGYRKKLFGRGDVPVLAALPLLFYPLLIAYAVAIFIGLLYLHRAFKRPLYPLAAYASIAYLITLALAVL